MGMKEDRARIFYCLWTVCGELVAKLLPSPDAPFTVTDLFLPTYFEKIDLLRGVSEVGKKSHFLSTRRLFEGV
jgi:hypothetical protein